MSIDVEERARKWREKELPEGGEVAEIAYLTGWHDRDKESGWISVEDRLPEDGQTIIYRMTVATPNGNRWKLDYGEWDAKEQTFYSEFFDHRDLGWDVGHWMPLPAPPTEEA